MPTASSDGVDLYYAADGSGETVAFVGEAGYGAWQWSFLHPQVAGPYEALVTDLRGTGRSDAPAGPYRVEDMASDLEAVLADHGTRRAHVVGAGLGGMVALRYAREYGRAASLTLFGTSPSGAQVDEEALRGLGSRPEDEAACRSSLEGALSPEFRDARPDLVEQICEWRIEDDAGPEGFEAQVGAALAFESGPLYEIDQAALVMHGVGDPVVPEAVGEGLASDLPRGEYVAVEGRHLPYVEHASAVADRWLGFLDSVE